MKELNELKETIDSLIARYRELKLENEKLKQQLEAMLRERQSLYERVGAVEQKLRKALEKIEILEK